ncbi:MAG: M15 family metallopeptidase [Syntrophomonadaceae bacterium]|nr:M15 family metallopeptidase [Syntrophomonadaceae bacterium]
MNRKVVGITIFLVMVVALSLVLGSYYKSQEPVVVTKESKLEENSILLQAIVTSNGGKELSEYGFNWGTSPSLDNQIVAGVSIGENSTYEMRIDNIEPGKTYYYQAYAVNDKGTGYGEIKEITIPIPPNEPPSITAINPETNLTVTQGEVVNISAQAEDDKLVVAMEILINDEVKQESDDNTINYDWDTSSVKAGEYPVKVTASDGEEITEETITIVVKEKVAEEANNTVIAQKPITPSNNTATPSRGSVPVAASSKYPKMSKVNGAFGQFPYRDIEGGRIEIDPEWVKQNIVTITLPGLNRQVQVHKDAAENFIMAFNLIKDGTAVIDGKEVPLLSLIKTMDGTFVPRHVNWNPSRGLSNHSWGTAIDINAAGHFRYVDPVKEPNNPNLILWEKAFKPAGFSWGNSYSDAMHYEIFK